MARHFSNYNYAYYSGTPVSGAPLTMCAWIRQTSAEQSGYQSAVELTDGLTNYIILGTNDDYLMGWDEAGGYWYSSSAMATDVWNAIAFRYPGGTNVAASIYLNGVRTDNPDPQSTWCNPTSYTVIGADEYSPEGYQFYGDLAEIGIWNASLTDAEIAALARGVSPLRIRPQNLVSYFPMWNVALSTEPNLVNGVIRPTYTGSASQASHPPVMPPLAGFGGWRATSFPSFYQGDMMPLLF